MAEDMQGWAIWTSGSYEVVQNGPKNGPENGPGNGSGRDDTGTRG